MPKPGPPIRWSLPTPEEDPTLLVWNRLEPAPFAPDGQLDRALRAEVADGLWMLTRQWQFGELRGEDTGSPVLATLSHRVVRTDEVRSIDGRATDLAGTGFLTPFIEAEAAPADPGLCLRIAAAWLSALRSAGLADVFAAHRLRWPLAASVGGARASRVLRAVGGRALDGVALLAAFRADRDAAVTSTLSAPDATKVRKLADDLVATFVDVVLAPAGSPSFVAERLEYGGGVHTKEPGLSANLALQEHTGDAIAWHSFDAGPIVPGPTKSSSFIPTPAEPPGMPSERFWAFEDRRVAMTHADLQRTDTAKALFLEYMLVFSNDWAVVPLVQTVGTHVTVTGVRYVDSFGVTTEVSPVDDGTSTDPSRFSLFQLTRQGSAAAAPGFWAAPLPEATAVGSPVEEVWFARDPDANLAWAVERVVPDGLGGGEPRTSPSPEPVPDPDPGAMPRYRLGKAPPHGWYPLVYQADSSGTNARFAFAPAVGQKSAPQGAMLSNDFWLHESELPRDGIRVVRSYRRALLSDGTPVVWLGRTVSVGHGEARSGLAYDLLEVPGGLDRSRG